MLVAHGHHQAGHYPVHRVWEEAHLLTSHLNHMLVSEALLTQMAVASLFTKEGDKQFQKMVKSLT